MNTKELNTIKKPKIVIEGKELIPNVNNYVKAKDYPIIDENQLLGVNLCIHSYLNKQRGFLIADHTGFGKTMTELVVADYISKTTNKKVLIVSENAQILTNNFANDEKKLSIKNDLIVKATYNDISSGKIKEVYEAVIFDEAHNLKNEDSQKSIGSANIKSNFNVYATATPMDTISGCNYFVSEVTGMSENEILDTLGLQIKIVEETDNEGNKTGKVKKHVVFKEGESSNSIYKNVAKLRDDLISRGLFIRRVYPFWGVVENAVINLPDSDIVIEDMIQNYWDNLLEETKSENGYVKPSFAKFVGGQKSSESSRWNETTKIDYVFEFIKQEISDGRKVVVIAEYINETYIKSIEREFNGFIGSITKKFEDENISYNKGYNLSPKEKSVEINEFQENKSDVIIGTPKSLSTGVDLDDQNGNAPRTLIMVTPNYSGNIFQQILGRISRRNTKSPSKVILVYTNTYIDARRKQIVEKKLNVLKAIQEGKFDSETGGSLSEEVLRSQENYKRDVEKKQKSDVPDKKIEDIEISNYKNSVLVTGNTYSIKDKLKEIGGKYNKFLKGWVFPKFKKQELLDSFSKKDNIIFDLTENELYLYKEILKDFIENSGLEQDKINEVNNILKSI